jgi:hypothetical protein
MNEGTLAIGEPGHTELVIWKLLQVSEYGLWMDHSHGFVKIGDGRCCYNFHHFIQTLAQICHLKTTFRWHFIEIEFLGMSVIKIAKIFMGRGWFKSCYWAGVERSHSNSVSANSELLPSLPGVTILLSLTVFLNMVSATMPVTSDNPLLGKVSCFFRGRNHKKQLQPFERAAYLPTTYSVSSSPRFPPKLTCLTAKPWPGADQNWNSFFDSTQRLVLPTYISSLSQIRTIPWKRKKTTKNMFFRFFSNR